ncbi:hypothetical protein [Ancylobacter sp. SL191]|uniref:hypothetical protein n=1 Tax=Ancylobacter sp. SL191 TaxID=2995166 RepID=UPI002270BE63|nr:hypothetical protein [Ancylobacter sp. SL191]WAC27168.1 hypothetical protein OU996_19570 [Ancylobacter sp. SL191]
MTRTFKGRGWLRTSMSGSSTASYSYVLDHVHESRVATGDVRAELAQMVEARSARRATLVLESGRWMPIEVLDMSAEGLKFRSVGDISFLNEE